jgi:hypothetical protein
VKVPAFIILASATVALAAPAANAGIAMGPLAKATSTHSLVAFYPSGVSLKVKKAKGSNTAIKVGQYSRTAYVHGGAPVKVAKAITKAGKTKSSKSTRPDRGSGGPVIVIWGTPSAQTPSVSTGIESCQMSMVDCTPQQECEIWGSNCNLVELPNPQAAPAESASSETSTSGETQVNTSADLSTGEVASSESSASDSSTTTSVVNTVEENWEC